jgi:outer membrane murein-binding lipoprotein Lpp
MREDVEIVASQVAELTRTVEQMGKQLAAVRERADAAEERADEAQHQIDFGAAELLEVTERLHAAATALRKLEG